MDFELSTEQVALRDELRRFLTKRVDHDARWAAADHPGGVDRDLWRELASMGVFGICTPESEGGVGLGLADATIVFEELGRVAAPGPVVSTCVAAFLIPGALDGSAVVGVVTSDDDGPLLVEHLEGLDVLLVLQNDRLKRLDPPSGTPLPRPLDPMTPVSVVDAVPDGHVVPDREEAARLRRDGRLLTAAFQIGLAQAAVDMGTEYARQRQQFGKVIGSFQAVKHLLADATVGTDVARAGVHAAAVAIDEADGGAGDAAATGRSMSVDAARAVASAAAQRATEACIQVHGGMGFTWELDAHLFLKRSLALDTTFGTAAASLDAVASTL
jgi:alkylation response protein AidB-like acyl-CoA dehydrogenase